MPNVVSIASAVCTGRRASTDAIVWLGQARHSTYDATHKNTLNASMSSVARFYPRVSEADVLVWHEGDLSVHDADALSSRTNVRWCLLEAPFWGAPPEQRGLAPREARWSIGYLSMIRWYAHTCWDVLAKLGYEWMMRFDDDSFLLSHVPYNLFGLARSSRADYGFRTMARECDRNFGEFVDEYIASHRLEQLRDDGTIFCERFPRHCDEQGRSSFHPKARVPPRKYCDGPGRLGFYNNWFVTRIAFWTSDLVREFRNAYDRSGLIFTHRANDLIFQTAAVRLFLPRRRWRRFADWTYQHHTIRDGHVAWGGLETGYDDARADATLDAYLRRWHPPESLRSNDRVRACRVQLAFNDTRYFRVLFVPHGKTKWNWLAAPYCNRNGFLPIW